MEHFGLTQVKLFSRVTIKGLELLLGFFSALNFQRRKEKLSKKSSKTYENTKYTLSIYCTIKYGYPMYLVNIFTSPRFSLSV